MAKYDRNEQYEAKYLHKVWSGVDAGIRLPESLTGSALLSKIEGIHHPAPVSRKIRFGPRIFTWQSGVAYAAAFVVIVGVSAFLNNMRPKPELLQGGISIALQDQEAGETAAYSVQEGIVGDVPNGGETAARAAQAPIAPRMAGEASQIQDTPQSEAVPFGVGGQGQSVLLGEVDGRTYTYRPNDPTDPDKAEFPLSVNVMDTASGELVYSLDIPDMVSVLEYYISEDTLALVGVAQDGTILRTYDLAQPQPVPLAVVEQPGVYLSAVGHDNILRLLTLADSAADISGEVNALPDSEGDSVCVITALEMGSGKTAQAAFSGAGIEAILENRGVTLTYDGPATVENDTGRYTAQIRFQGMDIFLDKD